jgi:ribosomal protein S18 acetylase RimI-like enzyme
MTVRAASPHDIDTIVAIHLRAFPDFFLSSLGPAFLACYYRSVMAAPDGLLLGHYADDTGILTGFCAATARSRGFHRRLVRTHFIRYAFISLRLLFTRSPALLRLIRNMSKSKSKEIEKQECAELLSIATCPRIQKKGTGSALLEALGAELLNRGCGVVTLTTDVNDNAAALGFYRKNGFEISHTFVAYPNRPMYLLTKRLAP